MLVLRVSGHACGNRQSSQLTFKPGIVSNLSCRYELARDAFARRSADGATVAGWQTALCGTCGGVSFWSVAFPIDSVKSRLQSQGAQAGSATTAAPYDGIYDCMTRVVREEGVQALYRGFTMTVVRAACVGSSVFYTYEVVRRMLG